ncbi:MAG TPA: glucuronyl hydrolase [Mucilaginibacter sp.]
MKHGLFLKITACLIFSATTVFGQKQVTEGFNFTEKQLPVMLSEINAARANYNNPKLLLPRTLTKSGGLSIVPVSDWCSGFFPGELWYLFEYTKDPNWLSQAKKFTAYLEPEKFNKGTHDLGFEIYCSFGNGYRLTHDTAYKSIIIQSARSLSSRFDPKVGAIKSWGKMGQGKYTVIIDNMMNLELLFEATRLSGDSSFYKIAIVHANTTLKNHFRPDYSSYHVVNYDQATGGVIEKVTAQGYNNESAWARGQAWGLYGYTMCYRETKDNKYLVQAGHIADFILHNPGLPKDLIPYWDYNVPDKINQSRDVSAAAITASALLELGTYSKKNGKEYNSAAIKILDNLKSYRAKVGETHGFLLLHSTGNAPIKVEIDAPLIYADYYYLEALTRLKRLNAHRPVVQQ